jgi:hypothetical protein
MARIHAQVSSHVLVLFKQHGNPGRRPGAKLGKDPRRKSELPRNAPKSQRHRLMLFNPNSCSPSSSEP